MKKDESYSEKETIRRRETALKRMLSTPHQPHRPLKKAKHIRKGSRPSAKAK